MTTETQTVLEHHGVTVPTLVFTPDSSGSHPAVVLAAEAYGVNAFTRQVASRLAEQGYVVVVPDYYRGDGLTKPDDYSDFTEVMRFIDQLDFTGATNDVLSAIAYARTLRQVDKERIAVWGYCTGGTLAMLAASLDRNLSAAVWFFPSQPTFAELTPTHPIHPVDLLWSITCPVLVIYGDADPIGPPEFIADLTKRFERWGIDHQINIYPGAGHAFSAPVAPLRHDAADAASWVDALDFLARRQSIG